MLALGWCVAFVACEPAEDGGSAIRESDGSAEGEVLDPDAGRGPSIDAGASGSSPGLAPEVIITPPRSGADAEVADAGPMDSGSMDSGPIDSGSVDSGPMDSGPMDGGPIDSGPIDSGAADDDAGADPVDATVDTGLPDASLACTRGQPCCPDNVCLDDSFCAGQTCGCIRALHGDLYLRTDGTVVDALAPMNVVQDGTGAPLDSVIQIHQGHDFGCGLRSDRTVWCWPRASIGNTSTLGRGPSPSVSAYVAAPVLLEPPADAGPAEVLTGVDSINQGSSHCYLSLTMCAVRTGGSLVCWGVGNSGGGSTNLYNDGGPAVRSYATPILAGPGTPLDGVWAVSVGSRHVCMLRGTGEVWCWGANIGGPLGVDDTDPRTYPVQVTLPGPAWQVGAGPDFTCALVGDGVYCWGHNNSGQIGIGDPAQNHDGCINYCRLTPAQVLTDAVSGVALTGVASLNVVYQGACALKYDGTLDCWGAGVGNVASPLTLGGNPVQQVSMQTSCGSNDILQSLRYLSTDSTLYHATVAVTPQCP